MKTDMHPNSLSAYDSIIEKLPTARSAVFAAIRESQPVTRQALSESTGWPINRITGRVRELLDTGLVEERGSALGPDKKKRALLVCTKLDSQPSLF